MSAPDRLKAMTAHVVYFDRVGFSALTIEQQSALTEEINELIRRHADFQEAVSSETVLALDTGDGQALVFLGDPQVAASVAMHIVNYSRQQRLHKVRVGFNTGPVTIRTDLMGKPNATGSGIDIAARLQSIAEPDVLYISQSAAEQLSAFAAWRAQLVDLGMQLVKHAQQIHVFTVTPDDELGSGPSRGIPEANTGAPDAARPVAPVALVQGVGPTAGRKKAFVAPWIIGVAILAVFGVLFALRSNRARGASGPLAVGLVAHYQGDGNAEDSAGTHDGMLIGGNEYGRGAIGQAFQLDGVTQFVQVPSDPELKFVDKPFTLSLWVNFRFIRQNANIANVLLSDDEGSGAQDKWIYYYDGNGAHVLLIQHGPNVVYVVSKARFGPALGAWHMYTVTRQGNLVTFYVDGRSLGTSTTEVPMPSPNATFSIGQAENNGFVYGGVDDVRVYRRSLNDAEVAALFKER